MHSEPLHPGRILQQAFLEPLGLTPYRLAKDIRVPQTRIGLILSGKRAVTPDTALRLSKYFGLEDDFWLIAQMTYDLAAEKNKLVAELDAIPEFQPQSFPKGSAHES